MLQDCQVIGYEKSMQAVHILLYWASDTAQSAIVAVIVCFMLHTPTKWSLDVICATVDGTVTTGVYCHDEQGMKHTVTSVIRDAHPLTFEV
jgi:hypothetical protein